MKCINCKYHSVLDGRHWCDFDKKKPKRIKPDDAIKDVPCIKLRERIERMTESEAIVCLQADKEYLTDMNICDGEEMDVAINALEKQIPKKPLFGTVHNDTTYHCSNCKNFIGFYDTRIYEYCHNCGQKLDWQTRH